MIRKKTEKKNMLIRNARFVITQNKKREILENTDILIVGGKIVETGKNLPKIDEVIDARNKIVIPGLINSHTHSPMALFRGITDDKDLHSWLYDHIIPEEEKLNEETAYYGSLLSIIEKIATGTTTFNEMYSYIDAIVRAVNKSGIRAFLSTGLRDYEDTNKTDGEIRKAKKIIGDIKENNNSLIKPALSLHWTLTCSDNLIQRTMKIDKNLPIFMHICETLKEVNENIRLYGKRPVERLHDLGALSNNFVGVHAVNLSNKEICMLTESGSKVVYNPSSNMKLAGGICPVNKLLKNGVCVSLGTDSAASNDNLNLFEEMKIASLLQKVNIMKAHIMGAQETLDMATTSASTVCRDKSLGSIAKGKYADLVFIDKNNITINPILGKNNILSNLIYGFNGMVSDVLIDGKFVLKDYDFTLLNKDEIFSKIREIMR